MPVDALAVRPRAAALPPLSTLVAFGAGATAAFTVSVVGEEPIGELFLAGAALWAILCLLVRRAWPGPLLASRYCRTLLIAETVVLAAYVVSDLYRGSLPHDYIRGWSRIVFLGLDVVGVAYLFGRSPRNFIAFVAGQMAGGLAHAALFPALFGDLWKFGYATPVTELGLLVAPLVGAAATVLAAAGLGALHLVLNYRSEGGICILVAAGAALQRMPRRARVWLAPALVLAAAAGIAGLYVRTDTGVRADRSDLERTAMMTVAARAFVRSPLVGYGSWFSNTRVYDDFVAYRAYLAQEEHVPGFPSANSDVDEALAFHSQILVALAEGGLFGGSFFIVYGIGLLFSAGRLVFRERWCRWSPIALFVLTSAAWDLIFSPFSGAQRITVAETCGLILLILQPGGFAAAFR